MIQGKSGRDEEDGREEARDISVLILDKGKKAKYNTLMAIDAEANKHIDDIMSVLSRINLYRVILFGSYAYGTADEESDIDLLIVLDDNTLPHDYDEWLEIRMKVRRLLRNINNEVAIDLLVYTKPQYEMIKQEMNSFQKEIHETGKILYEKAG